MAGTAPAPIRLLPRFLARLVARAVLALNGRWGHPGSTLRERLPGVRYDFHDVAQADGRRMTSASLTTAVLLISGTRSPAFLQRAARDLQEQIHGARCVVITGAGHDGPWDKAIRIVAAALRTFFAQSTPSRSSTMSDHCVQICPPAVLLREEPG